MLPLTSTVSVLFGIIGFLSFSTGDVTTLHDYRAIVKLPE
jgi:hypothetical protein